MVSTNSINQEISKQSILAIVCWIQWRQLPICVGAKYLLPFLNRIFPCRHSDEITVLVTPEKRRDRRRELSVSDCPYTSGTGEVDHFWERVRHIWTYNGHFANAPLFNHLSPIALLCHEYLNRRFEEGRYGPLPDRQSGPFLGYAKNDRFDEKETKPIATLAIIGLGVTSNFLRERRKSHGREEPHTIR